MSAEHERADVLDRYVQLHRDEGAHARRVEHAGHADDALLRELRQLVERLRHRVERVGDGNDDRVRRVLHQLRRDALHDVEVVAHQVVAAHRGGARLARRDDNDVGVRGIGVILGADHIGVAFLDRHGFQQVQTFALGHAFNDVDQYDIREFFGSDPVSRSGAYVA